MNLISISNYYQIKLIKMMKNYDQSDEINLNWTYIPDHPYETFITGGSGSTKFNMLLNLIKINNQILMKIIYASKTQWNQSINCS